MGAPTSILRRWLRRKPIEKLTGEVAGTPGDPDHLGRSITLFQFVMFGVGATIGTGIFFVLGETVPVAGPAAIVSFAIAGAVAGLMRRRQRVSEVRSNGRRCWKNSSPQNRC